MSDLLVFVKGIRRWAVDSLAKDKLFGALVFPLLDTRRWKTDELLLILDYMSRIWCDCNDTTEQRHVTADCTKHTSYMKNYVPEAGIKGRDT